MENKPMSASERQEAIEEQIPIVEVRKYDPDSDGRGMRKAIVRIGIPMALTLAREASPIVGFDCTYDSEELMVDATTQEGFYRHYPSDGLSSKISGLIAKTEERTRMLKELLNRVSENDKGAERR